MKLKPGDKLVIIRGGKTTVYVKTPDDVSSEEEIKNFLKDHMLDYQHVVNAEENVSDEELVEQYFEKM